MVQTSKGIQIPLIQPSTADTNVVGNIPESLNAGTSHATSHEHTAVHNKKAMRLMAQLIKFYKFYYLLCLNKRWLNSQ